MQSVGGGWILSRASNDRAPASQSGISRGASSYRFALFMERGLDQAVLLGRTSRSEWHSIWHGLGARTGSISARIRNAVPAAVNGKNPRLLAEPRVLMSHRSDSNRRPTLYESVALPTELRRRAWHTFKSRRPSQICCSDSAERGRDDSKIETPGKATGSLRTGERERGRAFHKTWNRWMAKRPPSLTLSLSPRVLCILGTQHRNRNKLRSVLAGPCVGRFGIRLPTSESVQKDESRGEHDQHGGQQNQLVDQERFVVSLFRLFPDRPARG